MSLLYTQQGRQKIFSGIQDLQNSHILVHFDRNKQISEISCKGKALSSRSSSCVQFADGQDQNQEGLNTETGTERNHTSNKKTMDKHFLWLFIDQIMEHKDTVTRKKKSIMACVCIQCKSNTDNDLLSLWYVSFIVSLSRP